MTRFSLFGLALLALLLPGAAPGTTVEDLLRRGNAAFAAEDYPAAITFYDRAEVRATDPGQVAYNRGTARYRLALAEEQATERLQLFRKAELDYRCAADAAEPRRSRALFGLANSLLQGRSEEASALREAIRSYRACLQAGQLDAALAKDARHNLELAKLLWLKAKARAPRPDEDPGEQEGSKSKQKQRDERNPTRNGNDTSTDPNDPDGSAQLNKGQQKQQPNPTNKTTGGAGTLPPVAEGDKSPPLTAEEADKYLKQAIKRIDEERSRQRLRSARTSAGPVKDW